MQKPGTPAPAAVGNKELVHIPGAEPSARIDAWWGLLLGVIVIIALLVISTPDPYGRIFRFVQDGLWVTVYITFVSFLLILVAGLIGALGRLSKNRVVYGTATAYVELVRGIPLLVQLIWWYYAFPPLLQNFGRENNVSFLASFQADPAIMAIVGLVVCYGAYMSEVYRAGIQSIPRGQMEAARSLGMNYFQSMRYVILPQAIRVVLPSVGNEFIALLKDSSLVSAVAVADMTRRGREFQAANFITFEVWILIALIYLTMTLFSARVVAWIEKRTQASR
jgi:polar amino acid transport system permease protein